MMKLREHISISIRAVKMMEKQDKPYLRCLVYGSILSALRPFVIIWFEAKLIDLLTIGSPPSELILYAALTVASGFLMTALIRFISTRKSCAQSAIYRAEEHMYTEKAMEMAYESIESRDIVALRNRIQKETQCGYNRFYLHQCVEEMISQTVSIVSSVAMSFAFFLVPAVSLPAKLLLILGAILAVSYTLFSIKKVMQMNNRMNDSSVEQNVFYDKFYDYTCEYEVGAETRVYQMDEYLADQLYENQLTEQKLASKYLRKSVFLILPQSIISSLLQTGLYLILIYATLQGGVTVGSIAKYVSCLTILITAVARLFQTLEISLHNNTYLKRYFSYFDIPNNMYGGTLTVEKRDDNEYYVEFRNVSFQYPNTEAYALRNINFKFKVGEKLAIVGMNGSGKTTFIKLLCRLYDPTEGEILLNGVNIKKYDYDEYMSTMAVVFQDFRLFAFTLGENVAASSVYDRTKVKECLIKAGFGDRLSAMSEELDTYIYKHYSDDGVEISGGEAQKIALARALYKDAPFVILDEPTSALDPISEYEVYSQFNSIAGDKTTIYISHRLASCRFCNKIAVFDSGNIVQMGSHEKLIQDTQGKYYALWNAQAQYYTEKQIG